MHISDIYLELIAAGFAKSQVQFSEFWLGRSKRYYSGLIAVGRDPGLGTMVALEGRLRRQAAIATGSDDRQLLWKLSQRLQADIDTRGLVGTRRYQRAASSRRYPAPPSDPNY